MRVVSIIINFIILAAISNGVSSSALQREKIIKKVSKSCFHLIFYIIYTIQTHYFIIKDVDSTVSNFFSSSTQSISEFSL